MLKFKLDSLYTLPTKKKKKLQLRLFFIFIIIHQTKVYRGGQCNIHFGLHINLSIQWTSPLIISLIIYSRLL